MIAVPGIKPKFRTAATARDPAPARGTRESLTDKASTLKEAPQDDRRRLHHTKMKVQAPTIPAARSASEFTRPLSTSASA